MLLNYYPVFVALSVMMSFHLELCSIHCYKTQSKAAALMGIQTVDGSLVEFLDISCLVLFGSGTEVSVTPYFSYWKKIP